MRLRAVRWRPFHLNPNRNLPRVPPRPPRPSIPPLGFWYRLLTALMNNQELQNALTRFPRAIVSVSSNSRFTAFKILGLRQQQLKSLKTNKQEKQKKKKGKKTHFSDYVKKSKLWQFVSGWGRGDSELSQDELLLSGGKLSQGRKKNKLKKSKNEWPCTEYC